MLKNLQHFFTPRSLQHLAFQGFFEVNHHTRKRSTLKFFGLIFPALESVVKVMCKNHELLVYTFQFLHGDLHQSLLTAYYTFFVNPVCKTAQVAHDESCNQLANFDLGHSVAFNQLT